MVVVIVVLVVTVVVGVVVVGVVIVVVVMVVVVLSNCSSEVKHIDYSWGCPTKLLFRT